VNSNFGKESGFAGSAQNAGFEPWQETSDTEMLEHTNPIYETSPMEITASFLNGSGGSLASTETFSMSANFSALDLQSSPGLLYSSDIIYTPAQLRLTFVPLAKIHAGSKIKVKLPALYTHDGTSYHIPQVTSTVFCTSIAGISGTLGCTYSTSDNY